MRAVTEFLDNEAYLGPLDNDAGVKPFVPVNFGNYGPFVFARVF